MNMQLQKNNYYVDQDSRTSPSENSAKQTKTYYLVH